MFIGLVSISASRFLDWWWYRRSRLLVNQLCKEQKKLRTKELSLEPDEKSETRVEQQQKLENVEEKQQSQEEEVTELRKMAQNVMGYTPKKFAELFLASAKSKPVDIDLINLKIRSLPSSERKTEIKTSPFQLMHDVSLQTFKKSGTRDLIVETKSQEVLLNKFNTLLPEKSLLVLFLL